MAKATLVFTDTPDGIQAKCTFSPALKRGTKLSYAQRTAMMFAKALSQTADEMLGTVEKIIQSPPAKTPKPRKKFS